jgi:hypothetical protein
MADAVDPKGRSSNYCVEDLKLIDISDFDNDGIKRAFYTWNEKVSTNPAYWKDGFKLEMFRNAFRTFLIAHADCLYKLFTGDKD